MTKNQTRYVFFIIESRDLFALVCFGVNICVINSSWNVKKRGQKNYIANIQAIFSLQSPMLQLDCCQFKGCPSFFFLNLFTCCNWALLSQLTPLSSFSSFSSVAQSAASVDWSRTIRSSSCVHKLLVTRYVIATPFRGGYREEEVIH